MLQRICFIYIIVSFLCVAFHSKYWQLPSGNQTVELARIRLFSVCDFSFVRKKKKRKRSTRRFWCHHADLRSYWCWIVLTYWTTLNLF
jgi:hypothetical protein